MTFTILIFMCEHLNLSSVKLSLSFHLVKYYDIPLATTRMSQSSDAVLVIDGSTDVCTLILRNRVKAKVTLATPDSRSSLGQTRPDFQRTLNANCVF